MVAGAERGSNCFISCGATLGEPLARTQLQQLQRDRNREEKSSGKKLDLCF